MNGFRSFVVRAYVMVATVAMLAVGSASATEIELPPLGVDLPAILLVFLTGLGGIIAAALLGGFALRMVKRGWAWIASFVK